MMEQVFNLRKISNAICRRDAALGALAGIALALSAPGAAVSLRQGTRAELGGRTATVTKLETLPYVESEYTKRFKFDAFENPKIKELRERYYLEVVTAPGKDEFDKQVLLMDWVHQQFKK